ncbi:MAG: hypothetical protein RIS02_843, partial [Pseudomonadota bacterium]
MAVFATQGHAQAQTQSQAAAASINIYSARHYPTDEALY